MKPRAFLIKDHAKRKRLKRNRLARAEYKRKKAAYKIADRRTATVCQG